MKAVLRPSVFAMGLVGTLVSPALAQKATPDQMGGFSQQTGFATMHLKSNLGSFRMIDAKGRVEMDFTGTVLVSKLNGTVEVSGGLKKEFEGMGRTLYHGTGHIVVSGDFRALQWFGSDMRATWFGQGLVRLLGEFDKDLSTGEYWYDDPDSKGVWPSQNTMDFTLPENISPYARGANPVRRGGGGN